MKPLFATLTALLMGCTLTACGGTGDRSVSPPPQAIQEDAAPVPDPEDPAAGDDPRILVACFSATGNTEGVARHLEQLLDAEFYEIVPEDPYTQEDLNYSDEDCRANQERNDPSARPAIDGGVENMADYDVVFLGYPIWWGQAPKILHTFLERYDFEDVTIVPFCTSGSSGIGSSAEDLRVLAPGANWLEGTRFAAGASQDTVAAWVESLDLADAAGEAPSAAGETQLLLTFDGGEAVIALADNATTRDFLSMLPAVFTFEDYAGTEKISDLDRELSTADKPASCDPQPGDVALYAPWGNFAVFYEDAGSSSGLVPMGRVLSGLELLAAMEGTFEGSVSVR